MNTVEQYNFAGKKALVRVDFNVPLNDQFEITDDTRIKAAMPTLQKILKDGGSLILMSHLGRPKDGYNEKFSLKHLVKPLSDRLALTVKFAADCIGNEAETLATGLQGGEVLLLENLRFHKEEKKGDEAFAQKLAKLGDVYVNDAFGTAHRAHASTAVIAQYFDEKVSGYVMQAELDNAQKVLEKAEKPFTAIMGGAKISDKILVIEQLLDKVDNLLIGGAMAYTFFKAQGGSIGKSLVEEDKLELAKELINKARDKGVNLLLPEDSVIADDFKNDANRESADNMAIKEGYMGLDIGEKASAKFSETIQNSKTILWNGPMGVFEMPNFANGTIAVAKAVVEATQNGGFSLIGGGDSAAAVNNLGFGEEVSYVSTGGGALLEYMEGKTLPGVKALEG
ncbi:phosphoglycerate kinase [Microscilla marina]|uniref:Phosphoglycerate kinase n=1 Tax=Microscilla marina ATCC 23134 TaxID=313606 RepID=A1ZHS5_MICM2|nr:phosphoglycerate kinase [Microscilla marina]EAY30082.1 phosphoglycerate kinase [Microscilla marina ATCC 23134]